MYVTEMVRTTTIIMTQIPATDSPVMVSKEMVVRLFVIGAPLFDLSPGGERVIQPEFVTIKLSDDGLTDKVTLSGKVVRPKARKGTEPAQAEKTWAGMGGASVPDWLRDQIDKVRKSVVW